MPTHTPLRQLAQARLGRGRDLDLYVRSRQAEGLGWRAIAESLRRDTNPSVIVSHETLRSWYTDDASAA